MLNTYKPRLTLVTPETEDEAGFHSDSNRGRKWMRSNCAGSDRCP